MSKGMTARQARFVREYLVDLNGTQAAIRAGYSERTANEQAARLLAKVSVRQAVQEAMAAREARTEITQDMVLRELARVAFGDPRALMDWGPDGVRLRDSGELTEDEAAAVAEISQSVTASGGSLKLKRHDKVRALELLGKHLGMFTDMNVNVNEPPRFELVLRGVEEEAGMPDGPDTFAAGDASELSTCAASESECRPGRPAERHGEASNE